MRIQLIILAAFCTLLFNNCNAQDSNNKYQSNSISQQQAEIQNSLNIDDLNTHLNDFQSFETILTNENKSNNTLNYSSFTKRALQTKIKNKFCSKKLLKSCLCKEPFFSILKKREKDFSISLSPLLLFTFCEINLNHITKTRIYNGFNMNLQISINLN